MLPDKQTPIQLLKTIKENKKYYTDHQVQQAKAAKNLLAVGYPHIKDLKNIIAINGVKNCPITFGYINITEKSMEKILLVLKANSKDRNYFWLFQK